jgi:hypothetical protein
MRTVGLLALVFLAMVLVGRIFGRDALLVISVTANLITFGLATARWWRTVIARSERNNRS